MKAGNDGGKVKESIFREPCSKHEWFLESANPWCVNCGKHRKRMTKNCLCCKVEKKK